MSDAASRVGIIVHFLRCHTNPIWRSTLLKAFFASSTYTVQQQRSRLAKPLVLDSFLGPETMEKNNREVKPRFGLLQNIESKHGIVLKICWNSFFMFLLHQGLSTQRRKKFQGPGTALCHNLRDGSTQLLYMKKNSLRKKQIKPSLDPREPNQAAKPSLQPSTSHFFFRLSTHTLAFTPILCATSTTESASCVSLETACNCSIRRSRNQWHV